MERAQVFITLSHAVFNAFRLRLPLLFWIHLLDLLEPYTTLSRLFAESKTLQEAHNIATPPSAGIQIDRPSEKPQQITIRSAPSIMAAT